MSKAVLLVGGQGTRLRPLTYRRPKALVPLLNEPLLSHEFHLLARHGITDIILAVGYKSDALQRALGDGGAWGVALTYVEDPSPLGTAGALKNVAEHLDGPFIAMNGDLVYDVDLGEAIRAHTQSGADVTFCLRRVEDISRFGLIQCDDDGWVRAFREKQAIDETGRNTVNSGLYIMSPQVLEHIPPGREHSNETQLFPELLEAGRKLLGFVPESEGYWADVGAIDAYLQASRDLLGGAVSWSGARVAGSAVIDESAEIIQPVNIADDVTIDAGARVGPNVTLGRACHIGRRTRLADCIVWDGASIGEDCNLTGTIVSDGVDAPAGTQHAQGVIVP